MLQVIDYSEKAIAVIGTTREDKGLIAELKAMKGKYNKGLKCGAGWVFSKAKSADAVNAYVARWNAAHPQTDAPKPQEQQPTPAPQPSPDPTPQAVEQPAPQTIAQAPATISIPIIEDELADAGAPF